MGTISSNTYKRLFLLHTIGCFPQGAFGKIRLQKTVYFIEKELEKRPFEFKHLHYGQYSEELEDVREELISMGYVSALPSDTQRTHKYILTRKSLLGYYRIFMNRIGNVRKKTDGIVRKVGLLPDDKLLDKAHNDPGYKKTQFGDVIIQSNLPQNVEIEGLSDEDCEELELSLNPHFISAMTTILEGLEISNLDMKKIKKVRKLV